MKVTSLERGLTKTVTTGPSGQWVVAGMPTGTLKIEASARGFQSAVYRKTPYDASRPSEYSIPLSVGTASETIEVATAAPLIETTQAQLVTLLPGGTPEHGRNAGEAGGVDNKKKQDPARQQASANVFNLQKKVAGVLPVRVDMPRAGSSYRFARALVLDEETKLTFTYKTR